MRAFACCAPACSASGAPEASGRRLAPHRLARCCRWSRPARSASYVHACSSQTPAQPYMHRARAHSCGGFTVVVHVATLQTQPGEASAPAGNWRLLGEEAGMVLWGVHVTWECLSRIFHTSWGTVPALIQHSIPAASGVLATHALHGLSWRVTRLQPVEEEAQRVGQPLCADVCAAALHATQVGHLRMLPRQCI